MIIKVDFVYSDTTHTIEKDSSILSFMYSAGVNFKVMHLVNLKPLSGTFMEDCIRSDKKLQEVKIYCDGTLFKRLKLTTIDTALYRCNISENEQPKEYIEIQYKL